MIENKIMKKSFQGFKKSEKVSDDYKCALPNETIEKVLESITPFLKEVKLKLYSRRFTGPLGIWTTIDTIKNQRTVFLSTGGKGMTLEYARASGLAELIERLKIGYLFSKNPYKKQLYPLFKKKVNQKIIEFNKKLRKEMYQENAYLPKWEPRKEVYIPYFHFIKKKEYLIKAHYLTDGTGCVAGNSYEEAFVQGLCEIFERYSVCKVLMEKIKCPNIPDKYVPSY